MSKGRFQRRSGLLSIPEKSSQILNLIFLVMVIIVARIWVLCAYDHQAKVDKAIKAQQKVLVESPQRGGIYDRFGIPLAQNQINYQAGVFYSPIRQIPTMKKKRKGKSRATFPRREYIEQLSQKLASVLHMDAERIEDLIHAKASLQYDQPFILKEGISQEQYYKLKILESQWPGMYVGMDSCRAYPNHELAGSVVGYLGAINQEEYESLLQEKRALETFLKQWQAGMFPVLPHGVGSVKEARARLKQIKERAFSIYDLVGKAGIEASFDEDLKGYVGKQYYYSDAKGQFFKPLPSQQKSLSGKQVQLSISAELQDHAEKLLAENERLRRSIYINPATGGVSYHKDPWIKGGAVVVMEPATGEVLALASFPRFDPNDFILTGDDEQKSQKNKKIIKWLESDTYLAQVWDGFNVLTKEVFDGRQQEIVADHFPLTWSLYLSLILPPDSAIVQNFSKVQTMQEVVRVQQAFDVLYKLSGAKHPFQMIKCIYSSDQYVPYPKSPVPLRIEKSIQERFKQDPDVFKSNKLILDQYLASLPNQYDQLLFIDLCKLLINPELLNESAQPVLTEISPEQHRELEQCYNRLEKQLQSMAKALFSKHHFKQWRKQHQKKFLKQIRTEERQEKKYPKPYIDYLDQEEQKQFDAFWQENKWVLFKGFFSPQVSLEASPELLSYLSYFSLWAHEIESGAHKNVEWYHDYQRMSEFLKGKPDHEALAYLQVLRRFKHLDRPLLTQYHKIYNAKPSVSDLAKSFYPRHGFSYARSYAFSHATPQGSLFKVVTAYEALRQKFNRNKSLSAEQLNPLTIVDDLHVDPKSRHKWNVGYFENGKAIPQSYKGGRIPRSHRRGIGRITLKEAIAVTSNCYFGLLASDCIAQPNDLNQAARQFSFGQRTGIALPGEIAGKLPNDLNYNTTGLYSYSIGQHTLVVTPLQSSLMLSTIANYGAVFKPQIVTCLKGEDLSPVALDSKQAQKYDFKKTLSMAGIDYPLFLCKQRGEQKSYETFSQHIQRYVEMPSSVRNYLIEAMRETVTGKLGTANPNRVRNYSPSHPCYQAYQSLKNQIVGKTSSAEIREAVDLDFKRGVNTYKHTWFGGIVFKEDLNLPKIPEPELVVVVYLRYGDFGREAVPMVASLAQKWREIKAKHNDQTHSSD